MFIFFFKLALAVALALLPLMLGFVLQDRCSAFLAFRRLRELLHVGSGEL